MSTYGDDYRLAQLRDKLIRDLTWELRAAVRDRRFLESWLPVATDPSDIAETQAELKAVAEREAELRIELSEMTGDAFAEAGTTDL
jgi:hypothetical protein